MFSATEVHRNQKVGRGQVNVRIFNLYKITSTFFDEIMIYFLRYFYTEKSYFDMPEDKMKLLKKTMVPTRKSTVIIFVLSLTIMFATYIVTQMKVMNIEMEDFVESIQAETKENLLSAKSLLDGMVKDLDYTARQLQTDGNLTSSRAKEILRFSHNINGFDTTFVADADGNAYDESGYEFSVADQPYFHRAMETKSVVFSDILPSKRFEAIQIIAYPMLTEEQEVEAVLFGLFKVETFSRLINGVVDHESVVDSEKRIYVVDSNGTYINCFMEEHTGLDHGNLWDTLKQQHLQGMTVEELKTQFLAGNEGDFFYTDSKKGVNCYGYHMPLGIQDWQIILTVEETKVNTHIQSIRRVEAVDLSIDTICMTVMLLCICSYFKRVNQKIVAANQKISKNSEMLRMAVEHSNYIIFEYDMEKRIIEVKTEKPNHIFGSTVIHNVPECFLERHAVDEESIAALKQLFDTIKHEKSSRADIQLVGDNDEKRWWRVSMYKLYGEDSGFIGIVGSVEDISMLKKGEAAIQRKEEMYKSFILNAILYARVDLDANTVMEINGTETDVPYEGYLREKISEYVSVEHQAYVAQALSLEALREAHRQEKESIEVQCLLGQHHGSKWVSCLVYRIHMSDNAKVDFLIRDIDEKKRREITLKERAELDGLTGLYNAVTTRAKINQALQTIQTPEDRQIFVLFDLDNFKMINDSFGHACGDQVLVDTANTLKSRLRSSDIIGRMGGDEFAVLFRNLRSDKHVDTLIDTLSHVLTRTYTQGDTSVMISASIGVALAPSDGSTFEELYQKADVALYQVKNEGKNGYRRYE